MPAKTHKVFAITLLIFLLGIIVWSARWGLADLLSYQTRNYLEQWQEQPPLQVSETNEAMNWIKKARSLDPKNPNLMNYQSQIFQWRAKIVSKDNENKFSDNLEQAAQLYRQSLALRPTWAFDWIVLASIKGQLQQFDNEFTRAIKRSNELAPWEYQIQIKLVGIGFSYWEKLTSSEQDIIHESFDRALQSNQFPIFIRLAKKYDQIELFCARTNMAANYSDTVKLYACNIK
jgi:hypothetical protein